MPCLKKNEPAPFEVTDSSFDMGTMICYLLLSCVFFAHSLALTYKGVDLSSIPLVESQGVKYTDGGPAKPFETILTSHGSNTARIRVWTTGQYNLQYGLKLAKRVKAAGMTLIVDLHYSDTCMFPSHPHCSKATDSLTFRGRSGASIYSFRLADHFKWAEHPDIYVSLSQSMLIVGRS